MQKIEAERKTPVSYLSLFQWPSAEDIYFHSSAKAKKKIFHKPGDEANLEEYTRKRKFRVESMAMKWD